MRALALLIFLQATPIASPPPAPRVVETSRLTTAVMGERVLDLAFVDASSLLVLSLDALTLYRLDGAELRLVDREPLTGPLRPVRAPGGLLVPADGGAFCWALTSGTPRAALFAVTRRGLDLQSEADAVPWPGVVGGVRFRAGTSLLEAALPDVDGPFLRLLGGDEPLAVGVRGEMLDAGQKAVLRVGPALAPLWPGLVAAASGAPPDVSDDVVVIERENAQPEVVARFTVPGAVRALASRAENRTRTLGVAIETEGAAFRIVFLELAEAGS